MKNDNMTTHTPSSYPLPPAELPEGSQDLWIRVCNHLYTAGFDLDAATPQIFNYCLQNHVYYVNAIKVSQSETPGVETFSNGNRGIDKNYSALIEARKQMAEFERNWGFNPLAVSKISMPDRRGDEPEDEFDL
jgi:phage terminase small subunit